MIADLKIRESEAADLLSVEQLYVDAFPEEDLLPLLRELWALPSGVISLVGLRDNEIIGHVSFTSCGFEGRDDRAALLAPLAVSPSLHKQGVGSALVRHGFEKLEAAGVCRVYVLGDPNYYAQFDFVAEDKVTPPYPLPSEWSGAWQSAELYDKGSVYEGRLLLPKPWQKRSLWSA